MRLKRIFCNFIAFLLGTLIFSGCAPHDTTGFQSDSGQNSESGNVADGDSAVGITPVITEYTLSLQLWCEVEGTVVELRIPNVSYAQTPTDETYPYRHVTDDVCVTYGASYTALPTPEPLTLYNNKYIFVAWQYVDGEGATHTVTDETLFTSEIFDKGNVTLVPYCKKEKRTPSYS